MGYSKKCLPRLNILPAEDLSLGSGCAGTHFLKGEIRIKRGIKSKKTILRALKHELKHFVQED